MTMRDDLKSAAIECGVPEHDIDPLLLYIFDGIEPGSFLRSFLENDLMGAMGQADYINEKHFKEIAMFLYNYAPMDCKGSREAVAQWLELARARAESK